MAVVFILICSLFVVGGILFIHHRITIHKEKEESSLNSEVFYQSKKTSNDSVCCGLHSVCEKFENAEFIEEHIYFDDEELDRFIGRKSDSYNIHEEDEFMDILLTMHKEDVPGWLKSLDVRKIVLPDNVRESALMIISEMTNRS